MNPTAPCSSTDTQAYLYDLPEDIYRHDGWDYLYDRIPMEYFVFGVIHWLCYNDMEVQAELLNMSMEDLMETTG